MVSSTGTSEARGETNRFETAIGEALFASTLATLVLTGQIASGRLSHDEAATMLDGATFVLEQHRGVSSDSTAAVDYARNRLTALSVMLLKLRRP
jgi:hypothetical protein